jgi:hypothetical protein
MPFGTGWLLTGLPTRLKGNHCGTGEPRLFIFMDRGLLPGRLPENSGIHAIGRS